APLVGAMKMTPPPAAVDRHEIAPPIPADFEHNPIMSGGPLSEAPASSATRIDAACAPAVGATPGDTPAPAAHLDTPARGRVPWRRARSSIRMVEGIQLPVPDGPGVSDPCMQLARRLLARHGWRVEFDAITPLQRHPILTIHRHDNAWMFSGYTPDTTVGLSICTPFGAPVLLGAETRLADGCATHRMPRAWRHECRVFIDQKEGVVSCTEKHPAQVGVTRRCILGGLVEATLRVFPPTGSGPVTAYLNMDWPHIDGETVPLVRRETPHGLMLETSRPVTGGILLSW